jgi:hypothetical protein
MKAPVSHLDDSDMQAAPVALMRAAERARRLAEQTGTRFVVRALPKPVGDGGPAKEAGAGEENDRDGSTPAD